VRKDEKIKIKKQPTNNWDHKYKKKGEEWLLKAYNFPTLLWEKCNHRAEEKTKMRERGKQSETGGN